MGAIRLPGARETAGFFFAPRAWPRFKQELAYTSTLFVRLIALTFINAGILPPDHPARGVSSVFDGTLTLRGIISEAWRRIDRKDFRQVAMFLAVIAFIAAVALGFLTAFLQASLGTAWAADAWADIAASQNFAGRWLQGIFGITTGRSPADIGSALGAMLLVYNTAALGLGVFLSLYNVGVVVMESAKHGRVGGQRHSMLWAPVRLIFGIGLLVPVSDGWNGGQLLTVWLAGQGSKVASSVWEAHIDHVASGRGAIVTPPMSAQLEPVVGTLLAIETCSAAFNAVAAQSGDAPYIKANVERQLHHTSVASTPYAIERSYDGVSHYPRKACGSITFVPPENVEKAGEKVMIAAQRDALIAVLPDIQALALQIVQANHPNPALRQPLPSTARGRQIATRYAQALTAKIAPAVQAQQGEARRTMIAETRAAGWVAAPAWLHTLSRLNAELIKAASTPPEVSGPAAGSDWPEEVRRSLVGAEQYWNAASADMGIPTFQSVSAGSQAGPLDRLFSPIGFTTVKLFEFAGEDPLAELISFGHTILAWAIGILSFMVAAVGWANSSGVAAVVGWMGGPVGAAASVAAQKAIGSGLAAILEFLAPLVVGIFIMLMSSAALLAVGLAVLPLVRWTYGCIAWLLGIFEAIVAVPLMLVAHLRSDGEGLPGPAAQTGYTIILGIILRPVLMIFSLWVGLLIFNNVVGLFNVLFLPNMKASAASGNTMGFFIGVAYVVAYCVAIYGFANASFKAIDYLPNQVLRWIGGQIMHDMDNSGAMERGVQRAGDAGGQLGKDGLKGAGGSDDPKPGRKAGDVDSGSGPGREAAIIRTEDMIPKELK